jgi:hypothetical protein
MNVNVHLHISDCVSCFQDPWLRIFSLPWHSKLLEICFISFSVVFPFLPWSINYGSHHPSLIESALSKVPQTLTHHVQGPGFNPQHCPSHSSPTHKILKVESKIVSNKGKAGCCSTGFESLFYYSIANYLREFAYISSPSLLQIQKRRINILFQMMLTVWIF